MTEKTAPTDLDGGIRQAQLLRVAGNYDDAIHILSQLMLVASDDPRVVSEYGKALAEQGRAQDATEFLNRAIELSGNDWTLYSALGVSYDQLGNQASARVAYEHALALKPNEASVLNNYALSRMLAGDADGAHILMARAEAAGGATDSKIAANIAMLNKLDPRRRKTAQAAKPQPPNRHVGIANNAPVQRRRPAAQNMPPPQRRLPRTRRASHPPRRQQQPPQQVAAGAARNNGVVMQAVPVDPLAGPVTAKIAGRSTTMRQKTTAQAPPPTGARYKARRVPRTARPKHAKATASFPALRLTANARNPASNQKGPFSKRRDVRLNLSAGRAAP